MSNNGLTKLIEECGGLITECAKKVSFPSTDIHPDGKGSMEQRMEDEIADVVAACRFVIKQHRLDSLAIKKRTETKLALYEKWHADPTDSLASTAELCSVCGEPQFDTPSGPVCKNGHGGA